jgi:hypothetical protein
MNHSAARTMNPQEAYARLTASLSPLDGMALDVIYQALMRANDEAEKAYVALAMDGIRPGSLAEGIETLRARAWTNVTEPPG